MGKDYQKWHQLKSGIENLDKEILFHEREVWWCSLGLNIGDEEDGKNNFFERPVLIFRKFNRRIFWGIPMTTRPKDNKFYFKYSINTNNKASFILSQLRLISSKRLVRKLATINNSTFIEIKKSIVGLIINESDSN